MRVNYSTKLNGKAVTFVPYKPYHVEKYHGWMTNPELQDLTASEPLSMKEEYDMQEEWHQDESKCTFILLAPWKLEEGASELDSMIGDVNFFINDPEEEGDRCEIEVMVAETWARRRGVGKEAVCMMMYYAVEHSGKGITKFTAKIKDYNHASIDLFKRLGFKVVKHVAVFQEIELDFQCQEEPWSEAWRAIRAVGAQAQLAPYQDLEIPSQE
eukprot:TRINITY_DN29293_c0_g1_i1.p1 TRINITY_DN29293_c0_g1~~TRINITY_DN29293_c0_g1_i1.p1  ORF type:complete len:213 (-),score=34.88 TRINITY_DN29293_c0_g1_i1:3-641(-)